MILEILLGGAVWYGAEKLKRGHGDKQTLDRTFRKCGIVVNYDGKEDTPMLIRSAKKETYVEYVYRIPEGKSFKDFKKIEDVIETALNKEITMHYDGLLYLRVFPQPLIEKLEYQNNCKGWEIPVGESRTESVKHDFDKIPHMLIGGTTRYGKSVFLKNIITTLIENQPNDATFSLIDLKGGLTFNRYKKAKQVLNVASDADTALEVLETLQSDLDEMMSYLSENDFENVEEAKIKGRHFIIIDEAAQLSPSIEKDPAIKQIKNKCEQILIKIASQGGGLGYRLIYATQTPYSEVLNHNIKQNCDAKLSFRIQTDKASEVILGEGIHDAHHLPRIKGRAVYLTDQKVILLWYRFVYND